MDTHGMDDEEPVTLRAAAAPVYIQAADPLAPAFGGAALAAAGVLMFGIYVLMSAVAGVLPKETAYFANDKWYLPLVWGGGLVIFLFICGLLIGKTTATRR
jgi:hypothetical protein